jgi:predicted O-methyltransferase YrrM
VYWGRRIRRFRALHVARPASLRTTAEIVSRMGRRVGDPLAVAHSFGTDNDIAVVRRDPDLSQLLDGLELDGFTLQPESLAWLVRFIESRKPRAVLEFGSGCSTQVLCRALHRLWAPKDFRLLSFDQDEGFVRQTKERLQALPGSDCCRVIHVPLMPGMAAGQQTQFYDLSKVLDEHWQWLGGAEFVFIDGPFADGPCRYQTLPAVRDHLLPYAPFAMDDALREKEIVTGVLWEQEGIKVDGVLTVGTGIMVGSVA